MKTKNVTVYVTYELGGKLSQDFPANMPIEDCVKAIQLRMENEGLIDDAVNFKCTHRNVDVDTIGMTVENNKTITRYK